MPPGLGPLRSQWVFEAALRPQARSSRAGIARTGPLIREAQRHLAQWTLQPIATMIAEEASQKLDAEIRLDVMQPLQAFDAGGRARAAAQVVEMLALAKEAGVDPANALELVNWSE